MREEAKNNPRRRELRYKFPDAGSSDIRSDMKHRTVDVLHGSWSHNSRRDHSGFNGCCSAMWKANGKTTILVLFLTVSILFGRAYGHIARQTTT
jgi:hypothetical protein